MPPPERQTPHGGGFMGEMDMGTSPQSLATVLATPVSDYRGKAGDVFGAKCIQFPCAGADSSAGGRRQGNGAIRVSCATRLDANRYGRELRRAFCQ